MTEKLPWIVVGLSMLFVATKAFPPSDESQAVQIQEFGRLPIVHQGRCKPIDTFARNSLMYLSGRQSLVDDGGKRISATQWLLDVMSDELKEDGPGMKYKVFRIENDQVLSQLGLKERSGFRYSLSEFWDKRALVLRSAEEASQLPEDRRDLFQSKIIELARKLQTYFLIRRWVTPLVVPPQTDKEEWKALDEAMAQVHETGIDNPAARSYFSMIMGYAQGDARAFNAEIGRYRSLVDPSMGKDAFRTRFEFFFNHFEPFYLGIILYILAFLLVFGSWLGWAEPLRKSALWLVGATLALHTFALLARMYLQGRPPVTNLYSSAVFIGWVAVLLGLVLEYFNRRGIGILVGSSLGFITLIIAHNLSAGGTDTLEMMRAVLDTNFWLATHVTCITIGYAATFIAGLLGIITIFKGVFTSTLDKDSIKSLARMTYGIVCFATLFNFVGTVLGGIWADQSWGRFWGWDPKENGALIIVLWNALILHARWGGMIRERGLAVLAVVGNIVTAWSWFGVNLLSVGLHSYGFTDSGAFWMILFVLSQIGIIIAGSLPPRMWRSLPTG